MLFHMRVDINLESFESGQQANDNEVKKHHFYTVGCGGDRRKVSPRTSVSRSGTQVKVDVHTLNTMVTALQ